MAAGYDSKAAEARADAVDPDDELALAVRAAVGGVHRHAARGHLLAGPVFPSTHPAT